MRRILGVLVSTILAIACAAPLGAETSPLDTFIGFPAYVMMQSYHLPIVASIMGKTYLYYEIYVLNAYGADIHVTKLTVLGDNRLVASFTGDELATMMSPLGQPNAAASHTIAAAETAVLYVAVPFRDAHTVPQLLQDELTFTVPQAGGHSFTAYQRSLRTNPRLPIVVAPPLRGSGWFAGEGPSNVSEHRRMIFFENGRPYVGQRFAIDWLQGKLDNNGHLAFFHGNPKQNADWYCWNQPVYAVADGTVIAERTDLPENVPLTRPSIRITQKTIAGNYIVIDIGSHRYAFYAHLRPYSITVRLGAHVKAGQIIGRLGNSGNSFAPHLHFHVTDEPEFILSDGEPYAFTRMRAATSSWDEDHPENGAALTSHFETYHTTMPGNGAVVDFSVP